MDECGKFSFGTSNEVDEPTPIKRTLRPIVTGGSVLGLKYRDGVMIATDTLAAYGSMARFPVVKRISKLGDFTMLAASGEYSDFQYLTEYLNDVTVGDWVQEDGVSMSPSQYASLLARILYQRRCKFNPLWNSALVAGYKGGKRYLGFVDLYGTAYEDEFAATGLGRYFALTLLRNQYRPDMSAEEAKQLLIDGLRVCFYRDTRASNRIQIGTVTAEGVTIEEPIVIDSHWDLEAWRKPTSSMPLAGCSW